MPRVRRKASLFKEDHLEEARRPASAKRKPVSTAIYRFSVFSENPLTYLQKRRGPKATAFSNDSKISPRETI